MFPSVVKIISLQKTELIIQIALHIVAIVELDNTVDILASQSHVKLEAPNKLVPAALELVVL